MGFLSSIFGGASPQKTVVQSKIPEELAPYVKEALTDTQALYKQRMAEGYDPYTGQRISELTPQQQQAMTGIEGLVGTQRPLQEEALAGYRGGDERFGYDRLGGLQGDYGPITERLGGLDFKGTPTEFTQTRFEDKPIEEYMSPYQRAVTDIEKREAQKSFEEQVMPQFEKQAIAAGGMSGMGARAGVQAGLLGQAQMQQLGDIEKKGLLDAYKDAQLRKEDAFRRFQDQRGFEERGRAMQERERDFAKGERQFGVGERAYAADLEKGERDFQRGERTFDAQQFAAQKARERQRAGDIAGLAPKMFASGLQEMGALQTVGEQRQAHQQQALDKAYADWMREKQFPEEQLARYTSSIYGNPILETPSKTTTVSGGKTGMGQQLLGLGTSLIGGMTGMPIPKMFAGGGYLGGLSGLPQSRPYVNYVRKNMGGTVYRQNSNQVGNPAIKEFEKELIETIQPEKNKILTQNKATKTIPEFLKQGLKYTTDPANIERVLNPEQKVKASGLIEGEYKKQASEIDKERASVLKKYENKINKLLEKTDSSKARFWTILGKNIATNKSGALAGAAVGFDEALAASNLDDKERRKLKREFAKDMFGEEKTRLSKKERRSGERLARKAGLWNELLKMPAQQRDMIIKNFKTAGDMIEAVAKWKEAETSGSFKGMASATTISTPQNIASLLAERGIGSPGDTKSKWFLAAQKMLKSKVYKHYPEYGKTMNKYGGSANAVVADIFNRFLPDVLKAYEDAGGTVTSLLPSNPNKKKKKSGTPKAQQVLQADADQIF